MASQQSLIFIPDISGFTEFVTGTAAEHSEHIISELLELLIDQNDIGLELAEIEGDALFFYKYQDVPDLNAMLDQVRKMYDAFHKHLKYYETHRICHCGACRTANNLTLKFVAHSGNFRFIEVKDTKKPFGEDVITAHRLLKNKVPSNEYFLLSETLLSTVYARDADAPSAVSFHSISDEYDFGKINYQYLDIGSWQEEIGEFPLETDQELANKIFEMNFEVSKPAEEVFELLTNFKYREKWNTGVEDIQYEDDRVNRIGSKHVCIVNNNDVSFKTITRDFGEQYRVYGERTVDVPGYHYMDSYYLLEQDSQRTKLIVRVYGKPKGLLGVLIRPIVRRSLKKSILGSIKLFKSLAEAGTVDGQSL